MGSRFPEGASLALREALDAYAKKQEEIALVILDRFIPGLSGGEAFDLLREINPEVRVLLSSGYSIEGQAQQIMNRGGNGFLRKPIDFECLSGERKRMPGSRERHRALCSRGAVSVFLQNLPPCSSHPRARCRFRGVLWTRKQVGIFRRSP
jgi:CheY-like chemotaxis protein